MIPGFHEFHQTGATSNITKGFGLLERFFTPVHPWCCVGEGRGVLRKHRSFPRGNCCAHGQHWAHGQKWHHGQHWAHGQSGVHGPKLIPWTELSPWTRTDPMDRTEHMDQNWSHGQDRASRGQAGKVEWEGGIRVPAPSEASCASELPSPTLPGIPSLKQEWGQALPGDGGFPCS